MAESSWDTWGNAIKKDIHNQTSGTQWIVRNMNEMYPSEKAELEFLRKRTKDQQILIESLYEQLEVEDD